MEYIGKLEYDCALKDNETDIVIFGAGAAVHNILDKMEIEGIKRKVVSICDNNSEKCPDYIDGIKVISFKQANELYHDARFIIYNKYVVDIAKQLIKEEINNIHYILLT